jgi:predicted esterase
MTGWFDLYDWPIDTAAPEDRPQVQQSAQRLQQEIQGVMREYNLSARQIVIGGFSQGGAIALVTAYHGAYGLSQERLGGCVNLSGWWPLNSNKEKEEVEEHHSTEPQQNVPLFWGHGRYDDKVLFEHQAYGVKYLKEHMGVKQIQAQHYPVGHSSDPNELRDLADFVDRVLFMEGGGGQEEKEGKHATMTTTTTEDKEL